jgi:MFS family permease
MGVNRSLKTLFVLNAVFVFAGNLLGPLYAIFAQSIDSKILSVSYSWAALLLSTVVFMFIVGKFGDRIKEKEYLLAAGYAVRAIAWFGYIFVTNIYSLLVIQVISGLGQALGTPAWDVIFAKHLDRNKEIMDYSDWSILSYLVMAISILVGGAVVTAFGFDMLFAIMGTLALIAFVGLLMTPRRVL